MIRVLINGHSGSGKSAFTKGFIASFRDKAIVVINIKPSNSRRFEFERHFSNSEYHNSNSKIDLTAYHGECSQDKIEECAEEILKDIDSVNAELEKLYSFALNYANVVRYFIEMFWSIKDFSNDPPDKTITDITETGLKR